MITYEGGLFAVGDVQEKNFVWLSQNFHILLFIINF